MSTQNFAVSVWKSLTDERKREIDLQIYKDRVAEISEMIAINNDEIIFYVLCAEFDFDKKQIRRLWDEVQKRRAKYVEEVEIINEAEKNSMDREFLKRYGIDVPRWRTEKGNWKPENDECWMEEEADE